MSVTARQQPWQTLESGEAGQESWPEPQQESLGQRYRRADLHDRLCLWLQFRDSRREFDRLEDLPPQ